MLGVLGVRAVLRGARGAGGGIGCLGNQRGYRVLGDWGPPPAGTCGSEGMQKGEGSGELRQAKLSDRCRRENPSERWRREKIAPGPTGPGGSR